MKKILLGLTASISTLLLVTAPVLAYVMSSTNYQIESDSINFGGGLGSSASYKLESSLGESGTGYLSSASYFGSMGYLQSASNTVPSFCDNDGVCEPGNGETTANCPNDCVVPVCNNNGVCEPGNGENASNCGDCQGGGGGGPIEPPIIPPTTTPTTTETFLIFNILARSVTTSSAEIVWETNRNAVCGLSWGLTTDYLSGSSAGLNYFLSHARPIAGLQASSTYHYKIFCQDQNSSTTESSDNIFTTLSGPDEVPPGNVIGLRNVPGNRKISLFWTNPSDYDFAGVTVRRSTSFYPTLNSGIEIYSGMGSPANNGEVTFDDLGLINGVLYYYSVFAYDTSGNFASGAATAGRPFEEIPEIPTTTPTTTPPEIPATTTPPEIPATTTPPIADERDLFFRDFDFTQDGLSLAVAQDQVDARLGGQLSISLRQSKAIPGTERIILYFSGKKGIETYLFSYDSSSQNYSAGLPLPEDAGRYNVNIILLDGGGSKIKEVSGWIRIESQEQVIDKITNVAAGSIEVFYDAIKPISDFAKSDAGKALAGVAVGVSAANLFFAVPWWNWYFLQFLFTQPWALLSSKRRKGWGTVYNSITKKPIDLALVRLYDARSKQLVKSRVTDVDGRYMFLVDEGDYYLQVQKPGFEFPSKLLHGTKEDDSYVDLYYGESFSVRTGERGVITANIPLDQEEVNLTDKQILKKHFKFRSLWRLSYLGPIFAITYFIVFPSVLAGLFAVLHLLLLLFFRRLAEWKKPKSWGKVYEKGSRKPLSKTITRVFSPEYNRMLEFYVTDNRGRYGFLAGSNKYYVTADKDGYQSIKTDIIDLSGKKASDFVIAQDLALPKSGGGQEEAAYKAGVSSQETEVSKNDQRDGDAKFDLARSNESDDLIIDKSSAQSTDDNNKLPPSENIFG